LTFGGSIDSFNPLLAFISGLRRKHTLSGLAKIDEEKDLVLLLALRGSNTFKRNGLRLFIFLLILLVILQ